MTSTDRRTRSRPHFTRALGPLLALCLLGLLFSASAQASGATAMGWGANGFGQLGSGAVSEGGGCACIEKPIPVKGLSSVTQIAGSANYTLALLSNGTVEAWGDNSKGQLGNNSTDIGLVSAPVPSLSGVIEVAAGGSGSLALLANGTVEAWGDNSLGGLGNGTTTGPEDCGIEVPCSKVPIPVPGLQGVVAIAANGAYNLALLSNGTVEAWGFDRFGQLGDGIGAQAGCECISRPAPVPGVTGAVAISAGGGEASALLANGTVKDWGFNAGGGLGNGTVTPEAPGSCSCLSPVSVSGIAGAKAVVAGGFHGTATLASGSLQAWGFNGDGELGNGTFSLPPNNCECIPNPAPVLNISAPQAIAAGEEHSLALLPNGSVEAWGHNSSGQLGDGTKASRNLPTPASGLTDASAIAAGAADSFALIGPSQALKVSLAGSGQGAVGTQGLLCPSACEARYPQSQVEALRAEPSPGSAFAGFSGPCSGTAPCQVKLDTDQAITATFGPPKGTAITVAKVNSKRKSASFAFSAPGAITGFECELAKPRKKAKRHHAHHQAARPSAAKKHKQAKPRFSPCPATKAYKHLLPGRYTLKARALDILGPDPVPASKAFRVKVAKVGHRHHGAGHGKAGR
jgi:alpha-tubulin suppressor-like RCC1 family protein